MTFQDRMAAIRERLTIDTATTFVHWLTYCHHYFEVGLDPDGRRSTTFSSRQRKAPPSNGEAVGMGAMCRNRTVSLAKDASIYRYLPGPRGRHLRVPTQVGRPLPQHEGARLGSWSLAHPIWAPWLCPIHRLDVWVIGKV